jgi:hypothetical protein
MIGRRASAIMKDESKIDRGEENEKESIVGHLDHRRGRINRIGVRLTQPR